MNWRLTDRSNDDGAVRSRDGSSPQIAPRRPPRADGHFDGPTMDHSRMVLVPFFPDRRERRVASELRLDPA